jgi:hypothetical protein
MVKKIYNVILQSAIGDGTNIFNETFFYDWGQIPDVPYNVSFSFVSSTTSIISTVTTVALYVDIAQTYNQIALPQAPAPSYKGQFLGNLRYLATSANNYLYADTNTNPSTFLNGRPTNNQFTVQILGNPTTDFTSSGPYSLILSFLEA